MQRRRIPQLVPQGCRLGRRLSRAAARPAGARRTAARRHRRAIAPSPPEAGRADGGDLRRLRKDDPARHDALAASALLRLFPGQCRAGLGGGRVSGFGHGRAVHAVADIAGRHRARDRHDRLAAPGARTAGRLFRRDPGFGIVGDAGRRADHAREGAWTGRATAGLAGQKTLARSTARTRCIPRSTGRSGWRASARPISCGSRPADAGAPWSPHALEAAISRGSRRGHAAGRHRRLRRRHQRRRHRRCRRPRARSPAARTLSACRCRMGRLGDDLPGVPALLGGRRGRRIRSSSTRTNGWARSSTARCISFAIPKAW